ncbi:MAG: fused response regulator/phosphatase [Desulfuromonadales bacterium]
MTTGSMTERPVTECHYSDSGTDVKNLTLLLVEDEQMSREMLCMRLEEHFKLVISAEDGIEGYQLFCEHRPDIVLTDLLMPGVSGLDLMREIRNTGADTPVVLMTSSIDNQTLLEAINGGVDRFVPKPFDFEVLIRTLYTIAGEIANVRLLEQLRQQEVESLRYREEYNSTQQEAARRKERHVVRHDLRNQVLDGAKGVRWAINVAYAPRDIMCGDGYSIRKLFDGRQLIFVADAMGSGMSASLTAILITSFFNYQVEYLHLWERFTLRVFLQRFQEYLSSMLLEDEVLSCGFFLVDLVKEEMESAVFALPPLLLRGVDGSVKRVCGENQPIGIYSGEVNIGKISLSGVADLLVMTDGVSDAMLNNNGGAYREVLESDYRDSPTLSALQRRFKNKTDPNSADDLTLLHLRRLDFDSALKWRWEPDLTLAGVENTIQEFLEALTKATNIGAIERNELETVLIAALTNALEHGCAGIERNEKIRLQQMGSYKEAIDGKIFAPDVGIVFAATLWNGSKKPLLLMEVRDNGPGVPVDALSLKPDGPSANERGLQMIRRLSDSIFIGTPGGCLIILKTIEGEDTYAD